MSSFYGGRDGRPFIISQTFEDIPTMSASFSSQNTGGSGINVGEYCLINTSDYNHPDNGKIFRRAFSKPGEEIDHHTRKPIREDIADAEGDIIGFEAYSKERIAANGAVFIGQIVGPAGAAPKIQLNDYNDVAKRVPVVEPNEPYHKFAKKGFMSVVEGGLLNPTEGNNKINWASYVVRDDATRDSVCYVGFQTPYPVVLFKAKSENPYYNRNDKNQDTTDFDNINLITPNENFYGALENGETNPFIQNWDIKIPKGIHGVSVENVRVIDATNKVVEITGRDSKGHITTQAYGGRQDDIDKKRKILVCDIVDYDWNKEGDRHTIYLGDYNMIDEISIVKDGTVTIEYSHDDDQIWNKLLTYITSATLDVETGKLDIETNNEKAEIHTDLTWVKNLTIDENGLLKTETTTGSNAITGQQLQWVKEIKFAQDGTITIVDINGTERTSPLGQTTKEYEKLIQWITNVSLSDEGAFKIDFNNGTASLERNLTWIKSYEYNKEKGTLTIILNNDKVAGEQETTINVKTPNNLYTKEDGAFEVEYNTGEKEVLGRFYFQGEDEETAASVLSIGGLWIETETIDAEVGE